MTRSIAVLSLILLAAGQVRAQGNGAPPKCSASYGAELADRAFRAPGDQQICAWFAKKGGDTQACQMTLNYLADVKSGVANRGYPFLNSDGGNVFPDIKFIPKQPDRDAIDNLRPASCN